MQEVQLLRNRAAQHDLCVCVCVNVCVCRVRSGGLSRFRKGFLEQMEDTHTNIHTHTMHTNSQQRNQFDILGDIYLDKRTMQSHTHTHTHTHTQTHTHKWPVNCILCISLQFITISTAANLSPLSSRTNASTL